jgi:hypothetical protein
MLTREDDIDVHALRRQGWTISAIARHLGRDRRTIRAYLDGREAGVRAPRSLLDLFEVFAPYCAGAMVTTSKTFTSKPWEADFEDALHDAWVETVHPALEAIDASVRDNKSLLALAAGGVGAAKATYPGLTIVASGLLGHAGAATALGGALSAAGPMLQTWRDHRVTARDIRMQPFYFLYALEQALP